MAPGTVTRTPSGRTLVIACHAGHTHHLPIALVDAIAHDPATLPRHLACVRTLLADWLALQRPRRPPD